MEIYEDDDVETEEKIQEQKQVEEKPKLDVRRKRIRKLRKMLDLVVHASQCRSANCPYLNCRKVKGLFKHGQMCRTRATGGCSLCKKMWDLKNICGGGGHQ
ncbi:hypothetical protein IFM89_005955 [Coptis chinensis]|uniref:histone acetyltransferase n=1 Tax=Coptis chinensis TaxID=261450 RepID=A0A835I9N8_9MAGN|nr:hypothetical protein IFM89_005955 [Coptis chinensis]